jgi:hypothetical protein
MTPEMTPLATLGSSRGWSAALGTPSGPQRHGDDLAAVLCNSGVWLNRAASRHLPTPAATPLSTPRRFKSSHPHSQTRVQRHVASALVRIRS